MFRAAGDAQSGPPVETDRAPRRLAPAVLRVWIIGDLIETVILTLIAGAVEFLWLRGSGWWPIPAGVATAFVFFALLLSALTYPRARYRNWSYVIREHDVLVSYGVFWKMRRCIPRLRIQHVDIQSGPIDRAFGLCKLNLYTAGSTSEVASIPGITPADAEMLREELLEAARVALEQQHG